MTIRKAAFVLVIWGMAWGVALADDTFTQADAVEMAEAGSTEEIRKALQKTLQAAVDESIGEAQKQIRERGSIVPYAYALNVAGEGQFLRVEDGEKLVPEAVAHGLQRTIVESALAGNLVGSILYVSIASPRELGIELEGNGQSEDARILAIEMQHLAGLGLLTLMPYWEKEGEWVFGEPQYKSIKPHLQDVVRRVTQKEGGEE